MGSLGGVGLESGFGRTVLFLATFGGVDTTQPARTAALPSNLFKEDLRTKSSRAIFLGSLNWHVSSLGSVNPLSLYFSPEKRERI